MSTLLEIQGVQVRPQRLADLPPGTPFLLLVADGGFLVGSLVRVTPGYAKVSIVGEEEEHFVPDKKKGGLRSFKSTSTYDTEWSRGTMVYPVPSDGSASQDAGSGLPVQSGSVDGSVPAAPPATRPQGAAASRGKAEATKPGHPKGRLKVSDSAPVQIDKKGQPVPPKVPIVRSNRSVPGGAVLKPSNAVKEEPVIPVKKEAIMAKVEKAKEKAALKGTSKALKPKEKKEKTPKVPTNICPGSGALVFRKFKPGMDARYYGWLKKIVRGQMKTNELPDFTRKYLSKVDSSIQRAIEKELTEHGVDVAALKEEASAE